MDLSTVLLILLAVAAALTIVFYQYFYKNPRKGSLRFILAALRFVTLFCGLLLLINPKFVDKDYFIEKSNLIFLVDQSSSMQNGTSENELTSTIQGLRQNTELNERFQMHQYGFGNTMQATDSVHFDQNNTNISEALSTLDQVFVNGTNAVVLLSDGNQTRGRDYEYLNLNENLSMFPIVVGDTTQYEDISVGLINVNKYAFLQNKFPIEATVQFRGDSPVNSTVTISINGNRAHQERVQLNTSKTSMTINALVEAESVGIKTIKVEVSALENEKNTTNNSKETAIEVIDEKTNVVIVSDMLHPDIGALKKSIEANEQRTVNILEPSASRNQLEEADIIILYQPNGSFRAVYQFLKDANANYFTITGSKTDFNFINRTEGSFTYRSSGQSEEIVPVLNNAFSIFGLGEFNVDGFPPLLGNLGEVEFQKNSETLMSQQIKGVNLDNPLFAIVTDGTQKEAILFGENIWRWRAQSYRNDQSFSKFDAFMGNLMVYLTANNQRNRLELDYQLVFDNPSMAMIRASYFDESYQFDSDAKLSITLRGKDTDFEREAPLLLKGNYYEVDLSDLVAGAYDFTVTATNANISRSGSFSILDFNPEQQVTASNYQKMGRLAAKTNGRLYFLNNLDSFAEDISENADFLPVQKSRDNVVSLIDFRILLGLMVLSLALEWFIRKYNGLI